ncbi:MAG: hypothetical protein ABI036_09040 [Fibrobacteria bacterium]
MTETDPFASGLSAAPRPAGRQPDDPAAAVDEFSALGRSLRDLYDLRDLPDLPGVAASSPLTLHPECLSRAARPILSALIETVLGVDAAGPLITDGALLTYCEKRIAWGDRKATATVKAAPWAGLLTFNALEAFACPPRRAWDEERRILAAFPANTQEQLSKQMDRKRQQDGRLLEFFLKKQTRGAEAFTEMDPAARRGYFWLWSQSGFSLKRRFHRNCRDAILAAARLVG